MSYHTGPRYNGARLYLNAQVYRLISIYSRVSDCTSHNEVKYFTTGTLVGKIVCSQMQSVGHLAWYVVMRSNSSHQYLVH